MCGECNWALKEETEPKVDGLPQPLPNHLTQEEKDRLIRYYIKGQVVKNYRGKYLVET